MSARPAWSGQGSSLFASGSTIEESFVFRYDGAGRPQSAPGRPVPSAFFTSGDAERNFQGIAYGDQTWILPGERRMLLLRGVRGQR